MRRAALICALLALAACAHAPASDPPSECLQSRDATISRLKADLTTLKTLGKDNPDLAILVADLTAYADNYRAATTAVCADADANTAQHDCLRRTDELAGAFSAVLTSEADPRALAYRVDTHLAGMEAGLWCEERARRLGGADSRGASWSKGSVFLQEGSGNHGPVQLSASLVCQRKTDTGYDNVPDCDGASLTEGDRFKVAFRAEPDAVVYVFLSNTAGQFQTLFPAQGVANRTQAAERYSLPPGEEWFTLDATSGILEHILVVAAKGVIEDLELLRGANLPPIRGRRPAPQGRHARALLDPLVVRGIKPVEGEPLPAGHDTVPTLEAIASRDERGVVAGAQGPRDGVKRVPLHLLQAVDVGVEFRDGLEQQAAAARGFQRRRRRQRVAVGFDVGVGENVPGYH